MGIRAETDRILGAGDAVLMVLLDKNAAFDMIDHGLLLSRLQSWKFLPIGGLNRSYRWF